MHIARPPAPVKSAQHGTRLKPVRVINAVPATHEHLSNGFAPSTESGGPSTDSGAASTDSRAASTDSGGPSTDSGAASTDSGAALIRSLANLELVPPLARVDTALGELEAAFIRVFRLLEGMAESAFNDLMRQAGRARAHTLFLRTLARCSNF